MKRLRLQKLKQISAAPIKKHRGQIEKYNKIKLKTSATQTSASCARIIARSGASVKPFLYKKRSIFSFSFCLGGIFIFGPGERARGGLLFQQAHGVKIDVVKTGPDPKKKKHQF